jgi:hypothetical protein
VGLIGAILRGLSYLFHLALALFMLGISSLAWMDSTHTLRVDVLPWTGKTLTHWLFFGALGGILAIVLAVTGRFRYLFPVWALAVFVMLARGYFWAPYSFEGDAHFKQAIYLTLGALVAFLVSLSGWSRKSKKKRAR